MSDMFETRDSVINIYSSERAESKPIYSISNKNKWYEIEEHLHTLFG